MADLTLNFKVDGASGITTLTKINDSLKDVGKNVNLIKWNSIVSLGEQALAGAKKLYEFAESSARVKSVADSFDRVNFLLLLQLLI